MESKLFLFDRVTDLSITYKELLTDLNSTKSFSKCIFEKDLSKIFKNLVLSVLYDLPVVVLNSGYSKDELANLGIGGSMLNDKYIIKTPKRFSIDDLRTSLPKTNRWRLSIFTSGTTGPPKAVVHDADSLTRMVKMDDSKVDNVWGFAYNQAHIAGLQVFFQAFMNLSTIINLFDEPKNHIYRLIDKFKITNIWATPTFYRLLLPFEKEYHSVKKLTSGGEKFESSLADELKKIFPEAEFLNVYAATEFGALFASASDYFTIKKEYEPFVKIMNNELFIHKKLLALSESIQLKDDWYNTNDLIEVLSREPLKFKFLGRGNEIINVGGYKVNPTEVEAMINLCDGVVASRVFGKKNSVTGNLLIAEVQTDRKISEREIMSFLNLKLQKYKIPRLISFVDKLDLTKTGKLKRA